MLSILLFFSLGCSLADDVKITNEIKGKFIFYALRDLKLPWNIYISQDGEITKFKRAISPLWSVDGEKIACVKDSAITIFDTTGNLIQSFPNTKGAVKITWSPDNTRFAYSAKGLSSQKFDKIFLYNIQTEKKVKLVDYKNEFSITKISFSPKGDKILFQKTDPNDFKRCGIYIYDLKHSSLDLISKQGFIPAWYPDGKHIVITTNRDEEWGMINKKLGVLMKININTRKKERIREVTSFIKDIRISSDGKYFYYSKPIAKGGYIIIVSPINESDIEIPVTKPVDLGRGQGYSQDLNADWYQGK